MHRSISVRPARVPRVPRILVALSFCAFGLAACQPDDGAGASALASESGLKPRERSRVLVEPVQEREMLKKLETTTKVESEFQHEIVPRASGLVTEVLVEEGDHVAAGQVLARLDDREARIASGATEVALKEARDNVPKLEIMIKEAESRAESARRSAEQAQRDFERNETISAAVSERPGLLSAKELEQSRLERDQKVSDYDTAKLVLLRTRVEYESAKNAVTRAELQLEQARLMLSYMEILAPAKGVIALRSLKVGDSVAATTSFSARAGVAGFTLVDVDKLRVVFYRPQRELALFHARDASNGEPAHAAPLELTATTEAMPEAHFRGAIERISPTIDAQSGAFRVTAQMQVAAIDDPAARLLPGMLVRLEIVTERHPNATVVPKRAVLREGEVGHVVVVRDGRAHRVAVEEGLSDDEYVEIRARGEETLKVGEPVVVVGNRDLEEGAEVELDASSATATIDASSAPAKIDASNASAK